MKKIFIPILLIVLILLTACNFFNLIQNPTPQATDSQVETKAPTDDFLPVIEPSQDDSHRTGVKRTTGADGQIEVTEVKGRYVPREGFDPLRRGSVRFDDVAVQADYYQRRFSEMTAPVSDGGAGRESRRAPFFIIPSGQRTASDSASSAVPPAID